MASDRTQMMTPPQLAERWGVDPDKVLRLIHSGQLRAINLAVNPRGRPRFRISDDAVRDFEAARSSQPPSPPARRRRRSATAIKEWF